MKIITTHLGDTALHICVGTGDPDCAKSLATDRRTNFNIKNKAGENNFKVF